MTHDYTKVHRDVAAGQIAGDLIKSGYYGEDIEIFGSICQAGERKIAVYGFDQESVALKLYEYFHKGAEVGHIKTKAYHLEKMNQDQAPQVADFLAYLKDGIDCAEEVVETEKPKFVWSGFAYRENGVAKTLINGYFPYVLEHYLTYKEKNVPVSKIEFHVFSAMNFEREEIKAELREVLKKAQF